MVSFNPSSSVTFGSQSNFDLARVISGLRILGSSDGKGLKTILNKSEVYRELSRKMPLIEIFTESDIDAVTCNIDLDKEQVEMNTVIHAAPNSEYAQLLNTTLGKPSDDVLKAIPNSMDYIFTMCVKGDNFVKLKQIQQLLGMFGKIPYIGRIDLASILSTVE